MNFVLGLTLSTLLWAASAFAALPLGSTPTPTPVPRQAVVRPLLPARTARPLRAYPATRATPAVPDEVIDLNAVKPNPAVSATDSGAGPNGSNAMYGTGKRVDLSSVFFHFYFDFWLINRPGFGPLTFQNIHSISMVEAQPSDDVFFSAEISLNPRYYEVKYAPVGKRWNLRVGKIWIPFDDINPHNHFGGRTNTRQLLTGNTLFLPNIWTELGLAFEGKLYDFRGWKGVGTLYVTNGFGAGGRNPSGETTEYPSFSDSDSLATDNNSDKAIGARLQFNYKQSASLGVSVYSARWTSQALESKRLMLLGFDAGYQLGRFELRGGLLAGKVDLLDGTSMKKGGAYAEFWTKFLAERTLRLALKAGILQPDDRYIGINDLKAIGAGLYYRPKTIQYSIEHSQDLEKISGKKGYGITWARLAILI